LDSRFRPSDITSSLGNDAGLIHDCNEHLGCVLLGPRVWAPVDDCYYVVVGQRQLRNFRTASSDAMNTALPLQTNVLGPRGHCHPTRKWRLIWGVSWGALGYHVKRGNE